ncbi:alginate export family protein [Novosphingobium cyanobacteriorum]|uniref:Alginate export family protein n=1 Tax=Novosphingobium cyanobacteriorum TaxID=3024215 RepID=A0ABT6CCQ4_9SPHN|nr:alginate export family protein [Novosphingobium cyanobacteriorum]MDF8331708.1 alginate export family protein [Novosphingobium cyanobacteriorum]
MRRVCAALASIGLALALRTPAFAQQVARTNLRYDEDWSRSTPVEGINSLKNVILNGSGTVRATFGLELRARYEGFDNTDWAQKPDDGYLWLRAMPYADIHAGPVRAFVQPIAGYARGVAGGPGPADRTGLDLMQGFAELRVPLRGSTLMTLRGGRQLIALGSERLVGLRYGPNIPQAFDGARVLAETGRFHLDLFALRPVQVGPGNFDDTPSDVRRLSGAYLTTRLGGGASADLYWLHYRNDRATFGGVTGAERRETYGLRLFGKRGRLAWNWETMIQRGQFAGSAIRAWSQATETSLSFPELRYRPRLRLRANIASGDARRGDGRLGTFNAMFPKGKYFGELSPIGPRNIVNLHPSLDLDLGHKVSLDISGIAFWRQTTGDGIYDVPGQLIRAPGSSRAHHIGKQVEMVVGWQATPVLSCAASLSLFVPGAFLRETGPSRPIRMAGLETMLKF